MSEGRASFLFAAGALACMVACSSGQHASSSASAAAPPPWAGLPPGPIGATGAARLLTQGTFGATLDGIGATSTQTYAQWFSAQVTASPTLLRPFVPQANSDMSGPWWNTVANAPDQLRQRVAFALSQILVVSSQAGALVNESQSVAAYADLLTQGALGNYRDLLDTISHSPTMGVYLTYFKNDKPNTTTGVHADENYAREIMQLFTVGLVMLNPDGSQQVDKNGAPVPTYGLPEVEDLARVFTGWGSAPVAPDTISSPNAWLYDYDLLDPMACYTDHHDTTAKTIIGGVAVPAGGTCDSEMTIALDTLFNHPNVGPFIGQQLIQRLVTSNPSPAYVSRVTAAFNDDGTGARGNLLAVVEAVLTDTEARTAGTAAKLREPVMFFTNLYRAFSAVDSSGNNTDEALLVNQGYDIFDERAYYSPTVFNFFRPNYTRPGPLSSAGLVAPEFQIVNEATIVQTADQLEDSVYQYVDSSGHQNQGPDGYSTGVTPQMVLLKTAAWEPFASDAGMLVDKLGLVFMEGVMPAAMRTTIVNYVTPINGTGTVTGNDTTASATAIAAQRVIDAAFLVVTSPQYSVQR